MYCLENVHCNNVLFYVQVLTLSEELQREKDELEQLVDLKEKGNVIFYSGCTWLKTKLESVFVHSLQRI